MEQARDLILQCQIHVKAGMCGRSGRPPKIMQSYHDSILGRAVWKPHKCDPTLWAEGVTGWFYRLIPIVSETGVDCRHTLMHVKALP